MINTSFPKTKIKTLLLENIHPSASSKFKNEGYPVKSLTGSLAEDEIITNLKDVRILGLRSRTKITRRVLQKSKKLWAIGAFCIGTNQIDLKACNDYGVAVFNAPYSNTRSVVELAMAEIILLVRNIWSKNQDMHHGIWDKSASNTHEIRGKSLGIIGYGNIGSQLSILAEAFGMSVYYYDKVEKLSLGNAQKCSTLKELLEKSDVVSIHVDGEKSNKNLIGEKEIEWMKKGSRILNLSRGFVLDIPALVKALKTSKLAGAAIDVYPEEPSSNSEPFKSELQNLPNVILTPHIGGSTEEAQMNIAKFVPQNIIQYMNTGNSFMSVNFPQINLSPAENAHRLIHIHHNEPGVLAEINRIMGENKLNIVGQYLKTNDEIGYVITDISKKYNRSVITELAGVKHSIRFRILY